jgi:nucleotide-binding universal stress UspA family protein
MFRILVPLDGSPFAEQALPTAAALARAAGAELKLIHVLDFLHFASFAELQDDAWLRNAHSDAAAYLDHHAQELARAHGLTVTTNVVEGLAGQSIQDEARRWRANLIVMSTHGHGMAQRAWLGSVADALVRESSTPVILVRAVEDYSAASAPAVFAHILVPLDGSTLAEQILEPVVQLAGLTGARITLLRAVRPWVVATRPMAAAPRLPELRERAIATRTQEARDYLNRIASSLLSQLDRVQTDVMVCEVSEASEILRYAQRSGVDLIALATHGRSGVKRLVLGSVADKLIRGAAVPVLVHRPV